MQKSFEFQKLPFRGLTHSATPTSALEGGVKRLAQGQPLPPSRKAGLRAGRLSPLSPIEGIGSIASPGI